MSGLCGWIGFGTDAAKTRMLVERMAAPLLHFDASAVRYLAGTTCAAAVAADRRSSHVYQVQGLRIALWGRFSLRGMENVRKEELAAALAERWRAKGWQLCADLVGEFALCIVDEAADEML